jgi:hypothetical protein
MTPDEQNPSNSPQRPTIEAAFHCLKSEGIQLDAARDEQFINALQGIPSPTIGRFQVYSSYQDEQTVVLIHDPSGSNQHKYIFGHVGDHTFVVGAPTSWTAYHWEILARISAATGTQATCSGGGYVGVVRGGELKVWGESTDFGPGDHTTATKAFKAAILSSTQN